jgi:hypothetical protein
MFEVQATDIVIIPSVMSRDPRAESVLMKEASRLEWSRQSRKSDEGS